MACGIGFGGQASQPKARQPPSRKRAQTCFTRVRGLLWGLRWSKVCPKPSWGHEESFARQASRNPHRRNLIAGLVRSRDFRVDRQAQVGCLLACDHMSPLSGSRAECNTGPANATRCLVTRQDGPRVLALQDTRGLRSFMQIFDWPSKCNSANSYSVQGRCSANPEMESVMLARHET